MSQGTPSWIWEKGKKKGEKWRERGKGGERLGEGGEEEEGEEKR